MADRLDLSILSRRQVLIGAGALGVAALVGGCADESARGSGSTSTTAAAGPPKRGGTLRFGYFGATANDGLDLTMQTADFGIAIARQMNAGIGTLSPSGEFEPDLAEEIEQSIDEVVVRLKQGLEFHNGKTITANDVLESYRTMADPAAPTSLAPFLVNIDMAASEVVDDLTVRFVLSKPDAFILSNIASFQAAVYPDGRFDADDPIGAGPFKVTRNTPGTSTEYVRFDNHHTPPLLDELIIQNFSDATSAANALTGGSVDAVGKVPANLIDSFGQEIKVLQSDTGGWAGFVMDASQAPFDDPDVRLAFKLLVDREQMIEQLQSGLGAVGNDLFSPQDALYMGDELDQRTRDVEQAKSLLAGAGAENLELDIAVSGQVPNSEVVLAEQLRAGGVTLNVNQVDSTTYFANHYAVDPIYSTLWPTLGVANQIALSLGPEASYPEGNYDNEEFYALWEEAVVEADETSRGEKLKEMQRIFHEDGTYLIWGFQQEVDAMRQEVQGGEPDQSGWPFKAFDFTEVYFS